MKKGLGVIILTIVMSSIFALSVLAQEDKAISVEEQLKIIIDAQKRIEQKLSGIEGRQRSILNTIGRMQAGQQRIAPSPPPPEKVHDIKLGDSPIRGKKDAKITIVEFTEIQCPYSQRFHPVLAEVAKAYPDDVRFVFKHFPLSFHPQARPGAKAMLAAKEQGKYWEMVDILFAKPLSRVQGESKEDQIKRLEEHFKVLAKEVGLDVEKFMKDYRDKDATWEKVIEADVKVANEVGVRGTPTAFLNGKRTRSRDFNSFKAEIDAILKEEKGKKK